MGQGRYSKYPNKAGIYKFKCIINDKIYIGKSINIRDRINSHRYTLSETNKRKKGYFESAIKKYGWDSFEFEILEIVEDFDKHKDNDDLLKREAYYIKLFDSTDPNKGYNLCKYSSDRTGVPCSEESKEKLRQANLGKKHSEETKLKMKESSAKLTKDKQKRQSGRPLPEETKRKLSKINKGKTPSKNTIDAIKNRVRKRYKVQTPSGDCVEIVNMAKFCRDEKLGRDSMDRLVRGIITNYMGWTFIEAVII
jgi:group I intron endonuclease